MVIEFSLSNNAGGSVTANGIAGKVTIGQLVIFRVLLSIINMVFRSSLG
ncbi:hypothetical protein ACNKHU_12560 [Shigella flexneri]